MRRPQAVPPSKLVSRPRVQGLAAVRPHLKGSTLIVGAASAAHSEESRHAPKAAALGPYVSQDAVVRSDAGFAPAHVISKTSNFLSADRAAIGLLLIPLVLGAAWLVAYQANGKQSPAHVMVSDVAEATTTSGSSDTSSRRALQSGPALVIALPTPDELRPSADPDLIETTALSSLIPAIAKESEVYEGLERRCSLDEISIAPGHAQLSAIVTSDASSRDFGVALAEGAQAQLGEFVVYTDSYKRLSFPMGDVPSLFGVCTDVIIRAYRSVGIDLQGLVHRARVGSGDTSIDHRRTEVLRRFFAAQGRSLPVTDVADDYLPGDIVTYHRPQNRGSQSHIAIVANEIGISGRPLIIHNRGWGPQLEDGLFVDRITGHYRYSGPTKTQPIHVIRQVRRTLNAKRAASALRKGAMRHSRGKLTTLSSTTGNERDGVAQTKPTRGF